MARAAIESGVARREIEDWDAYAASLTRRVKTQSKPESLPIRTGIKKAPRDLFGALFVEMAFNPDFDKPAPAGRGKTAIGKNPGKPIDGWITLPDKIKDRPPQNCIGR